MYDYFPLYWLCDGDVDCPTNGTIHDESNCCELQLCAEPAGVRVARAYCKKLIQLYHCAAHRACTYITKAALMVMTRGTAPCKTKMYFSSPSVLRVVLLQMADGNMHACHVL